MLKLDLQITYPIKLEKVSQYCIIITITIFLLLSFFVVSRFTHWVLAVFLNKKKYTHRNKTEIKNSLYGET